MICHQTPTPATIRLIVCTALNSHLHAEQTFVHSNLDINVHLRILRISDKVTGGIVKVNNESLYDLKQEIFRGMNTQ